MNHIKEKVIKFLESRNEPISFTFEEQLKYLIDKYDGTILSNDEAQRYVNMYEGNLLQDMIDYKNAGLPLCECDDYEGAPSTCLYYNSLTDKHILIRYNIGRHKEDSSVISGSFHANDGRLIICNYGNNQSAKISKQYIEIQFDGFHELIYKGLYEILKYFKYLD